MKNAMRTAYNFALLRAVPHAHTGAFVNVGVIVHARTTGYLDLRVLTDGVELRARIRDIDHDLLLRYLNAYAAVCRGDPTAGPIALAPTSERFHWLTSPRSDVLQTSPVHEGICDDPATALQELYATFVA